ncbi:hypothetical protein KY363_02530 [Candidatus Woesearchaeota archaeon]|nr:hypothetical protein [Candidatus Woesearchaeota archaeon]
MDQSLEARMNARAADLQADVISNVNDLRTGQLMDQIVRADKALGFLRPGNIVLVERNQEYLDEIMRKLAREFFPNHTIEWMDYSRPHHLVRGAKVQRYTNLDDGDVCRAYSRVKGVPSTGEKCSRKVSKKGRIGHASDRFQIMVRDVFGAELDCIDEEAVYRTANRLMQLPYLTLEKFEDWHKPGGYTSTHLNMTYSNGNPFMRGLEIEIQVNTLDAHRRSKKEPSQAHSGPYGKEKLASRRKQLPQLVMYGNSVELPEDRFWTRRHDGLLVAKVPDAIQPYILLVPDHN